MLGITLADAAVVCTIAATIVAIMRGQSQGEAAKKQAVQQAPFVGIAGSIVEANQFSDYIKTMDKLAIAIVGHTAALNRQHEVKTTNALEDLAEKIDAMRDDKHRRR